MYKKCIWLVAFAFSLILSQTALADSWGCGKGIKEMVESLNLSSDQKTKVKPILEQLKSNMKQNGMQMKALDKKLNQEIDAAKVDQAKVEGLIDQKTQIIGNMMKAKINAKVQIMPILDDKQKAELHSMVKKMDDEMAARFKNCHQNKK